MPELPEVETVVRGLRDNIVNKTIYNAKISAKKLRVNYPENFLKEISNKHILSIQRLAKYILILLDNKKFLVVHLGMSGKLLFTNKDSPMIGDKHTHLQILLPDNKYLIYNDVRRFGLVTVIAQNEIQDHKLFCKLGIEPLSDHLSPSVLYAIFSKKKIAIKKLLMDANILVGIGNIYAAEILFLSKIHPLTSSNNIDKYQSKLIYNNIIIVLKKAIEAGGSTLKDYKKSDGTSGYFQHKFNVYGREAKPCIICNTLIQNIKISGRSSFFCPECQQLQ